MNGNRGFSLIELLIVIGIISILVGISVPGIMQWSRSAKFKEAAQTAYSAVRQAKGQAININRSVTVRFTLDNSAANDGNKVEIGTGDPLVYAPAIIFSKGIEVKRGTNCDVNDGTVSIAFNPTGSSQSGYVCIFDDGTPKYRIGVGSTNTGRILLQKRQGSTWK